MPLNREQRKRKAHAERMVARRLGRWVKKVLKPRMARMSRCFAETADRIVAGWAVRPAMRSAVAEEPRS